MVKFAYHTYVALHALSLPWTTSRSRTGSLLMHLAAPFPCFQLLLLSQVLTQQSVILVAV